MNKNIIGENIQKHRKELGLTQAELAEMVQISTVHMSHIETGTASLSLSTLLNLCVALKVTPNDLLLGTYPLHFPDNDDQTKFLKEVLTTKLKDSIITNKNPVVVDFLTAVEYTQPFYDKKKKLTILLHILTGKLEYRILRQKRYVLRQNTNLFWILRHRQNSL